GYDEGAGALPPAALRSGYARLACGSTVVLVDAGAAPPMELAGAACAGCLSFELSSGTELLLVNAGMPGPSEASRSPVARATSSHNTLCLGERSSARLVRDARLERDIGGPPLLHPDTVTCAVREADGAAELDAWGSRLEGLDRLAAAKGVVRFAWDVPYAIHFHLHPGVEARTGASPESAELWLDSGELWQLTASSASVCIEESLYLADSSGPRPAQQVVLRAQCYGEAEVSWVLERIPVGEPAYTAAHKRRGAGLVERLAETDAGSGPADGGAEAP